jgi:hypothetical protein
MRFLKKDLKMMESIEEESDRFKEPLIIPDFSELKEHPKKLRNAIEHFQKNYFIWKEKDGSISYSGGMRLFVCICAVLHNNDRQKLLYEIIRLKNWEQLKDFKIIEKRERVLGIKLKAVDVPNGLKDFDEIRIIGEEL